MVCDAMAFPACLPRPIGRGPTSASVNTVKTDRPGRDETLSAERVNKAALYDTPDFLQAIAFSNGVRVESCRRREEIFRRQ